MYYLFQYYLLFHYIYIYISTTKNKISFLYKLFIILGIKDSTSLILPIKQLKNLVILQEELSKYNYKRVFNPIDEPVLNATTDKIGNHRGKRVFNSCDKTH
jgi:hypothetical protein